MKTKVVLIDLIVVAFSIIAIVAIWLSIEEIYLRLAIIGIIVAATTGGIAMFKSWISEQPLPKFKISNPKVVTEQRNGHTYKTISIDVKNEKPCDITGCKLRIETNSCGSWDICNLDLSIIPKEIPLIQITDMNTTVAFPYTSPNFGVKLYFGHAYDFDLSFYGENFVNKKVWHLELDLNSFDSCNLRIKTRREVFFNKKIYKKR